MSPHLFPRGKRKHIGFSFVLLCFLFPSPSVLVSCHIPHFLTRAQAKKATNDTEKMEKTDGGNESTTKVVQVVKRPQQTPWLIVTKNFPKSGKLEWKGPNGRACKIDDKIYVKDDDMDKLEDDLKNYQKENSARIAIKRTQKTDCEHVIRACGKTGLTILEIPEQKLVEARETQNDILNDAHLPPTAGHPGIKKMYQQINKRYYWPNMYQDVEKMVKNCVVCQKNKHINQPKQPLKMTDTANEPFEKVYLDMVGPLTPKSKFGEDMLLTIQDDLSKYVMVLPVRNKEATTVAKKFMEEWILLFGEPKIVVTDNGKEFEGVFAEVLRMLQVDTRKSMPYHHQTIGALENSHKSLGAYLRIYAGKNAKWRNYLKFFQFAYNTSTHEATGYSPFELIFGRSPRKLDEGDKEYKVKNICHREYLDALKTALKIGYEEAKTHQEQEKRKRKQRSQEMGKQKSFQPGDAVLVKREARTKLDPIKDGPFTVVEVNWPNVTLEMNGGRIKMHSDKVSKLHC